MIWPHANNLECFKPHDKDSNETNKKKLQQTLLKRMRDKMGILKSWIGRSCLENKGIT